MQRESSIEKPAVATLESLGWTVLKVGHEGYPDRLAIRGMKCFWLEFKTPKGTLTKAQERRIPKLEKARQIVIVVDNAAKMKRDIEYNYYPWNLF